MVEDTGESRGELGEAGLVGPITEGLRKQAEDRQEANEASRPDPTL